MVDIRTVPDLDTRSSEHLTDYTTAYQYCLNISYNDAGTPHLGSAIFIHCFSDASPYTAGCISLPAEKMRTLMQLVDTNCAVVINTLEALGGRL